MKGNRLFAVAVSAALVAGCNPMASEGITGKTIRYQVEHFGSPIDQMSHSALRITYTTSEGEQTQENVQLPWTKSIGPAGRGFKASLTAQFDGFGTIVCRIVADNAVIQTQTSPQEPYPQVACSA